MNLDLGLNSALSEGMKSAISREKSIEEINNLLFEANKAMHEVTEGKGKLSWRAKSYTALAALVQLSIPLSDVKIETQEPEHRVLFIASTLDPALKYDLTVLTINPNGYPCEMNVNGNKLISHDIQSLTDHFKILLSSAFVGEKVIQLKNQGAT